MVSRVSFQGLHGGSEYFGGPKYHMTGPLILLITSLRQYRDQIHESVASIENLLIYPQ